MKKIEEVKTEGLSFNDVLYRMDVGQQFQPFKDSTLEILRVPNGWLFSYGSGKSTFVPYSLPVPDGGSIYIYK